MNNNIGLYGLGVMGQSLARNIQTHGFSISVYNRKKEVLHAFIKEYPKMDGYEEVKDFINSLEKPRKIILMVADFAVDEVINTLVPLLDKEDILIDCGNTFYKETQRRQEELKEKGIYFIGSGVSGGERGALLGPSIMPSGSREAYHQVEEIFTKIAAVNEDGSTCCTYIGEGGSGHFVKMVHNGVEYADMQVIAEAYDILKAHYQNQSDVAKAWNILRNGKLKSYLMDITYEILCHKENDDYLLPFISDVARQKGTGKWTSQISFDYSVAIPSLTEAVQVRFLSTQSALRKTLSSTTKKEHKIYSGNIINDIEDALYMARISVYAQGLHLIQEVSNENNYQIDMKEIARIWQNGCIIKADFLKEIIRAYDEHPHITHLLESKIFVDNLVKCEHGANNILIHALTNQLYTPVLTSAMQYVNGIRTTSLCTNMIQAQRDFFGAHTYERIDKEGTFHTIWE